MACTYCRTRVPKHRARCEICGAPVQRVKGQVPVYGGPVDPELAAKVAEMMRKYGPTTNQE